VVKVIGMVTKIPSCSKNVQGMKKKKPKNGKVNLTEVNKLFILEILTN
jgi:hypothetical protein